MASDWHSRKHIVMIIIWNCTWTNEKLRDKTNSFFTDKGQKQLLLVIVTTKPTNMMPLQQRIYDISN